MRGDDDVLAGVVAVAGRGGRGEGVPAGPRAEARLGQVRLRVQGLSRVLAGRRQLLPRVPTGPLSKGEPVSLNHAYIALSIIFLY